MTIQQDNARLRAALRDISGGRMNMAAAQLIAAEALSTPAPKMDVQALARKIYAAEQRVPHTHVNEPSMRLDAIDTVLRAELEGTE